MAASSLKRTHSRYVQGGKTEKYADRLGYWDRYIFKKHPTDELYTIEPIYDRKCWLLANDRYNSVELEWFIYQYNTILDPHTEFVAGQQILLPTPNRLFNDILTKNREA